MSSDNIRRGMATRQARVARTRNLEMGLQAVRTRSALKRSDAGIALIDADLKGLDLVRGLLTDARSALEQGVIARGRQGDTRQVISVGLALETVADSELKPVEKDLVIGVIDRLVEDLGRVMNGETPHDSAGLRRFVDGLVRNADESTSSPGESLTKGHDVA